MTTNDDHPDHDVREYMSTRMRHEMPPDLVDSIMAEVETTPQRSRGFAWPILLAGGVAVAAGVLALIVLTTPPSGNIGGVPTPSPTPIPSSTPGPTASPSVEPSMSPDEPMPTPLSRPSPGIHSMTPEEAFEVPDDCENPAGWYRIWMPDAWYYNIPFDDFDACQWFSPVYYTVTDSQTVPAEIAIVLSLHQGGDFGISGEILSRDDYTVAGRPAVRFELFRVAGGFMPIGSRSVVWIVGIGGELPSETTTTPWLMAKTGTEMGGTYEDNVDVLDRMIATLQTLVPLN